MRGSNGHTTIRPCMISSIHLSYRVHPPLAPIPALSVPQPPTSAQRKKLFSFSTLPERMLVLTSFSCPASTNSIHHTTTDLHQNKMMSEYSHRNDDGVAATTVRMTKPTLRYIYNLRYIYIYIYIYTQKYIPARTRTPKL